MQNTCRQCGQSYEVTSRDLAFYKRMGVPPPTLCPIDMHRSRLSFRNETDLYRRTCDETGKEILTYHPPHSPYTIYERDVWWSDEWDPMQYGREIDFEKPFLEQFAALDRDVPKANIYVVQSENCEYTNYATHNKNCYLVFGSWFSENCLYGQSMYHCTGCIDGHYINKCQYCYECIDCNECYETAFSQNSQSCTNSWFLYDCGSCENCIGCWNLRRKNYHSWNQPVGKEEFKRTLQKLKTSYDFAQLFLKKFEEHVRKDVIHRAMIGEKNENVSGNFIYESRNVVDSYNVQKAEDIYYSDRTLEEKDQYFCTGVHYGELAFNCLNIDFSHNVRCCMNGEHQTDTAYCIDCHHVVKCFGCVGLRQKKHCILNKQYTPVEYEALNAKIIEHMKATQEWGEYFPSSMQYFFFNKTLAQDYFALDRTEAERRGYKWKEDEPKVTDRKPISFPDNVQDTPDSVAGEILVCNEMQTPYRITASELSASKKMGWSLPHTGWETRYRNRLNRRTPRLLFDRNCMNCGKQIQTTYAPDRPEKLFCEDCYLEAVY